MTEPNTLDDLLARVSTAPANDLNEELADTIERTLAAVPEDPDNTKDRLLRARLEGYVEGLRKRTSAGPPEGLAGLRGRSA